MTIACPDLEGVPRDCKKRRKDVFKGTTDAHVIKKKKKREKEGGGMQLSPQPCGKES